jgi:hypothetical protein
MKIKLLDDTLLNKFPSGSGIEFFENRLYLAGDDASELLVMNKRWKEKERVMLFASAEERIPKKKKADLEASTIIFIDNAPHLLLLGSGSREPRNKAILFNLSSKEINIIDIGLFYQRLANSGIPDLNIEGAALVNNMLVLANRGNKSNPSNHLVVTDPFFWRQQETAPIRLHLLNFEPYKGSIGLSGLCYAPDHEQLWFTTSMEDTNNSYDDGKIGNSYLGMVENIVRKLGRPNERLTINELVDLPATDKNFTGYKIESLCMQSEKDHNIKMHLVADNDTGKSHLFKIQLKW